MTADPRTVEAWTKLFLTVSVVIGFLGVVLLMLIRGTANTSPEAMLAVGALSAAFGAIVGYHYGSSSGSAAKQEMLTPKQGDPPKG